MKTRFLFRVFAALAAGSLAVSGLLYHARASADMAVLSAPPVQSTSTSDHALLMQLAAKVDADRSVIADLRGQVAAQQVKLNLVSATANQADTVAALAQPAASSSYGPFTVSGKNVYLTDYNLHIQSGSGSTDGKVNGYGNLIIGYNEGRGSSGTDVHTGSHNLIIGSENNYSGYSGIVGGLYNTSSAPYASVVGGRHGTASGNYSTVAGGYGGAASGQYASVSGGDANTASGEYASVPGGIGNTASGEYSSVTGGAENAAEGDCSSVTGGESNSVTSDGYYASVSGGYGNVASGSNSSLIGGYGNTASAYASLAGGGYYATASGTYSTCLGSVYGTANGDSASTFGGYQNQATGSFSSVTGGAYNDAGGDFATVSGGENEMESTEYYWKGGTYESK